MFIVRYTHVTGVYHIQLDHPFGECVPMLMASTINRATKFHTQDDVKAAIEFAEGKGWIYGTYSIEPAP